MPPPLPPAWEPGAELMALVALAHEGLGRLAGVGQGLPNPHLLIRPFVRREAVLSSRIEGTKSGVEDAVLFEVEPNQSGESDAEEVDNYVRAMDHGLARLGALPLSRRLLCEVHAKLLAGARGEHRAPGQLRRAQVFIGAGASLAAARFVPPPPERVPQLMSQLEHFLHERAAQARWPVLVRCAWVHYQFEAIHPFLDGNGRLGRLLITLLLCAEAKLPSPLLYLSAYFERHRQRYYDLLLRVSTHGDWAAWVEFFLRGVAEQSHDAIARARHLLQLRDRYRERLLEADAPARLHQVVDQLFDLPATTANRLLRQLGVSHATARAYLRRLTDLNIVGTPRDALRNQVFVAHDIVRASSATMDELTPAAAAAPVTPPRPAP